VIVRYTRQAIIDLDEARAFIGLDRPGAAEAMAARVRQAIDGLRQFPERGRAGRVSGTRELVVPRTPFVVPYRLAGREIQVLAALHGVRAWPLEEQGGAESRERDRPKR
jgi:plasmid stabilization system protein ParE